MNIAGVFEGGLVLVALGLAWWVEIDLYEVITFTPTGIACGMIAGGLLFGLLLVSERFPLPGTKRIQDLLIQILGKPLAACRWYDLILLAALVGFAEEALFRGVLQQWIERHLGYYGGVIWSNVLFGLAHAVTATYAVLAGLTGVLLGWLFDATGKRNLIVPFLTHAIYDYLAFLWIIRLYRRQREQREEMTIDD